MAIDPIAAQTTGYVRPDLRAEYLASVGRMTPTSQAQATGGASFAAALDQALQQTNTLQGRASELAKSFQTGASDVSLEDTMVALQKANLSFQMTVQVRNRLVSAYQDIMNMSV